MSGAVYLYKKGKSLITQSDNFVRVYIHGIMSIAFAFCNTPG